MLGLRHFKFWRLLILVLFGIGANFLLLAHQCAHLPAKKPRCDMQVIARDNLSCFDLNQDQQGAPNLSSCRACPRDVSQLSSFILRC
eukprot:806259-Amphidinium_carterae.2